MGQIYSALEKKVKLCVRKASFLNDEMDKFGHTLCNLRFIISEESQKMDRLRPIFEPYSYANCTRRDAFAPNSRRKCSKLLAVPCAFLLTRGQNRLRLNNFLN